MVPGPIGPVLVGAAILLTLYLAWRARGHTPATVFALGLWGSLLIAPYIHPQDLMLWIPAALLMRKEAGLPVWLLILGILFASTTWLGAPIVPALALLVLWRYLVMAPKVASASTVALAVTPSRAEAEGAR
jgi:hypothetical protein